MTNPEDLTEIDRLNELLQRSREHAEALDKNWAEIHDAAMSAIRYAVGDPDATVPEIVGTILRLRGLIA